MNRGRWTLDPPPGLTGSPLQQQQQQQAASSKPNRLSRSFRLTQQTQPAAKLDSPQGQQSEFKTPTRVPRCRGGGGFSGESPHNDSDFQQDIIWDATSPSPNRHGKRGKKQRSAGVVDISEIVSRIAPKHGRPEAAEPTLQQWIGDSATIPCTPDVQVPKPKKKSPRPNGVDDLLKLAKQFDFNMFRQDDEEVEEEEVADLHQQSLELLSDDIVDSEVGDLNDCRAAVKTDVDLQLDQQMEDDLDFLFDGPTQHLSGNLSQVSSQVKPASKESSGKPSASSHGSTCGVSTNNAGGTLANDDFEDDWENDDLLNDSLVLEITQNPQNFIAPKHCSTQKPPSEVRQSPVTVPVSGSAASKEETVRQRTTFKLESNSNFSVKRIQTDLWTNSKVDHSSETADKDTQQSRFSSGKGVLTWQTSNRVKSDPQKVHQRTSVEGSSAKYNMTAPTASNASATQTSQSVSSLSDAAAVSDLLDDDLHALFSSDPVWDDPADDDLLCELCEDLENQIQSAEQTLPTGRTSNQRAALQPANQQPVHQTPPTLPCASGQPAGTSLAGGFTAGVRMNTDSFSPVKNTGSTRVQGNASKNQFTFKKPNNPVSTGSNKVVVKCSAAEIELKKQQAMERRRQRLQAAQNLRAPT